MRMLLPATALGCLALALAVVPAARADGPDPVAAGAVLVVVAEGLRSDAGTVHAALYASEDGFPTKREKALRQADAPIQEGRARLVFDGIPPGGYAVAAYHDENGDGKLDTGFLGIPTEGLAASNDAKGFMGPPSFEKARVEVGPGETRITVRISY